MLSFLMMFLMGCQSSQKNNELNVKWEFLEFPPGRTMACTDKDGVKQIRERLIRCGELSSD